MIKVVTQVQIPLPQRRVWVALIDFQRYSQWHPFVAIRGTAGAGNEIEYSYKGSKLTGSLWATAHINKYREQAELAWTFGVSGLFQLEERFSFQPTENGTLLQHSVKCWGFIPFIAGRLMKQKLRALLVANEGLARYLGPPHETSRASERQGSSKRARRSRKRR